MENRLAFGLILSIPSFAVIFFFAAIFAEHAVETVNTFYLWRFVVIPSLICILGIMIIISSESVHNASKTGGEDA